MKNLFFLLLAACLLFSCAKEDVSSVNTLDETTVKTEKDGRPTDANVTLRDGYLTFDCEEDMEAFITGYSEDGSDPKVIALTYGFNSYLENVTTTPITEGILDDEYFAGTLNADGMIGVGSHIFKMNPATEEVFEISSTASTQTINAMKLAQSEDDLPENATAYSFDDDVFGMLDDRDSGCTVQAFWGCGETCKPAQKSVNEEKYCTGLGGGNTYYIHANYWKGGVWFYINTKLWHRNFSYVDDRRMDIRYDAKWKKRCRSTENSNRNYTCDYIPSGNDDDCFSLSSKSNFKKRFYHGTRCLSEYYVKSDARIQSNCEIDDMIWTDFVEIGADF